MTTIDQTPLGKLDKDGRLLNAVLKEETTKDGRFGFRGDIALKFQTAVADEKRPPDFSLEQVLTYALPGEPTLPILVGYIHSFAYLADVVDILRDLLSPDGTYILFCNNIDYLKKYRVEIDEICFHVLPLDESTVWKEMLDMVGMDKNDMKGLNTAGKLDKLLDAALETQGSFESITLADGIAHMAPVRNRNENRPV